MRIALHFQILVLMMLANSCCAQFIRDLFQFNGAGPPVVHRTADWAFDPEIGIRRSRQYQEINGVHGKRHIERLGLGIDGRDRERLAKQRARDEILYRILKLYPQ